MPDRVVRDELLESERWLSLKDNADRLAYIALLLKADSLGNFSAEPFRLMRLWRDFGINTEPLVAKALSELTDQDLVRLYQHDNKPYLHIPRFGQRMRYLTRVFPPSPWTTNEQKQVIMNKSPDSHLSVTCLSPVEVKRSEVKRSKKKEVQHHAASAALTIPDWIPTTQWDAWIEARKKRRNPPTDFAMKLAISKLENLKTQGHQPAAVLAQSAFRGWAGLFPVKDDA